MSSSSYPTVEEMLPHRDPFLFIQSVSAVFEDRVVCQGFIGNGHYLTRADEAPPILGIEMGAQAAGIHAALRHRQSEASDSTRLVGYLVAIRKARFHTHALPVDRALLVEAIAQGASGPLAKYLIVVRSEKHASPLVEARITTWAQREQTRHD